MVIPVNINSVFRKNHIIWLCIQIKYLIRSICHIYYTFYKVEIIQTKENKKKQIKSEYKIELGS